MKNISKIILQIILLFNLFSCSQGDHPSPEASARKQTLLIYAVASNDLYSNLLLDKDEILQAAPGIDLNRFSILVYQVTEKENPELLEVSKDKAGNYEYKNIKTYDKSIYSTDPDRIQQVINDARSMRSADTYGLILWSHATGIDPANPITRYSTEATQNILEMSFVGGTNCFSFGADRDPDKNPNGYARTDITDLAKAIPDHVFDYIWFDACYMAEIEVAYELKNKCNKMIAYPTEVYGPGAPYNLILPYLLSDKVQVELAAESFFKYYSEHDSPQFRNATISVIDMTKLDRLASVTRDLYKNSYTPSTIGVLRYTRLNVGPFYDFGQISKLRADSGEYPDKIGEFESLLKEVVIWTAATPTDFDGRVIPLENYCGISTYNYNPDSSNLTSKFYTTLSWYKSVFE